MKHIITALALVASTTASAQFYNGNELLQRMDSGETHHQMLAMGYVAGVVDMTRGEYHCAPANVTLGQVRDLTHNAIRRDPASRHLNGSVLVTLALMEVWPCAKKKGGNL
jgi:hypothetical protein